jgi:hypothetical protein
VKTHILFLYTFGFAFILLGCFAKDLRPERDCPIEELLLSQADYPSDTILNESRSQIAEFPLESAGGSANYHGGGTSQLVARFSSVKNAKKEYEKWEKIAFDSDDVIGSWGTPAALVLNNLSADRYKIACGNLVSFGNRCYVVGQYEEYFVFFWADISAKGITPELFQDLVIKIDEKMTSCLSR